MPTPLIFVEEPVFFLKKDFSKSHCRLRACSLMSLISSAKFRLDIKRCSFPRILTSFPARFVFAKRRILRPSNALSSLSDMGSLLATISRFQSATKSSSRLSEQTRRSRKPTGSQIASCMFPYINNLFSKFIIFSYPLSSFHPII